MKTAFIRRLGPNAPVEEIAGEELPEVPVYEEAGAGAAVDQREIEPMFSVSVPDGYLRRGDFALLIEGRSMEPLIPDGAVVGIRPNSPFAARHVYAAWLPYEGMVVKRVFVDHASGELVFRSENPDREAYPDLRVPLDDSGARLVGEVVWARWEEENDSNPL